MGLFNVGVEIPVLLIFFSLMLAAPINMNFIIYRTCYVIMGKNESDCARLGVNTTDNSTNELEKEVEAIANYISMSMDLVTLIIPCILCVFIGPWSDKKGRRPILIATMAGFTLANIMKVVIAAVPTANPWFLFLQGVPLLFTGGIPSFIMISFCYVIDISTSENRGLRMGIIEGVLALGMLLGMFLSSHVFLAIGYVGVFLISTGLSFLALIITFALVKETVQISREDCKFFSMSNITSVCHALFKSREGYKRLIILACVGSMVLYVMAENNSTTEILLLRLKFSWDLQKLTTYSTMRSIISLVGGFLGIYIMHSKMGVPELPLIIIALLFCAINTFMMAFAEYDWQIYIAASLRIMSSVVSPMIRSILSKIIPHEEVGQIFSFGIALESLIAMLAGPMFTVIYTSTLSTFPGAFDLIPFSLHIFNIILFILIVIIKWRSTSEVPYMNIQEDLGVAT